MPIGTIVGLKHYPAIYDVNRAILNETSTTLIVFYKNKIITFEVYHLLKDLKKFKFHKRYISSISSRLENQNILLKNKNTLNEEHFLEIIKFFTF